MIPRPSWRRHLSAQRVTLYLAGELSPDDAQAAQEHLISCQACARVCEDQRLAQRLLRAHTMERPLPAALDLRIQTSLRARSSFPRGAPSLRFLWATRPVRRRLSLRPTPASDAVRAPRHGAFPGVAAVLAVALLVFVAIGGVMPPLPALTLPIVGAGAQHPRAVATPTPNNISSPVNDPVRSVGAGGRQQMR